MATTGTKRVLPMAELCHNELARGVLEKNEGSMPESWIEMFKAHPRAWKQLTNAVVQQPRTEYEDLCLATENPLVSVTVLTHAARNPQEGEQGIPTDARTVNVWLNELPEWLAVLLNAYHESMKRSRKEGSVLAMARDSNGCETIYLYSTSCVLGLWANVIDVLRCDRVLFPAMIKLFDAFHMDLREQLADEIAEMGVAGSCEVDDADDEALVEFFNERCTDLLGEEMIGHASALASHMCTVPSWLMRPYVEQGKRNRRATYEKVPQLSLVFDFTTELWD